MSKKDDHTKVSILLGEEVAFPGDRMDFITQNDPPWVIPNLFCFKTEF